VANVTSANIAPVDPIVTGVPELNSDRIGTTGLDVLTNGIPDIIGTIGSQGVTEEIANLGTIGTNRSVDTTLMTATMLRTVRFLIIGTMLRKLIAVVFALIHENEMIVKIVTTGKFGNKHTIRTFGTTRIIPQFVTDVILDLIGTTVTEHISVINGSHGITLKGVEVKTIGTTGSVGASQLIEFTGTFGRIGRIVTILLFREKLLNELSGIFGTFEIAALNRAIPPIHCFRKRHPNQEIPHIRSKYSVRHNRQLPFVVVSVGPAAVGPPGPVGRY